MKKHGNNSRKRLIICNCLSLLSPCLTRFGLWFLVTGYKRFMKTSTDRCINRCPGGKTCIQIICEPELIAPTWANVLGQVAVVLGFTLLLIAVISMIRSIVWLVRYPQEKKMGLIISMIAVILSILLDAFLVMNYRVPV